MGSTHGHLFRVTTFGESHGPCIGVVIDGCPPGLELDAAAIREDLARRRPGQSALSSARNEPDEPEILSGLLDGRTLGSPIAILIRNRDARPEDYEPLRDIYRPGHADHTTEAKYGIRDPRGGGRASARETAARVAAGAVARRLLEHEVGARVVGWVDAVGDVRAEDLDHRALSREIVDASQVRCPDHTASSRMIEIIEAAREDGDSIGCSVACIATSIPAGWGEPVFDKLTADLARALMSIPAARGFEVGAGFGAVAMRGSEHSDSLLMDDGRVVTKRNIAGGVAGGISTGEDILVRVAFAPPATIARPNETITSSGEPATFAVSGRHDPCVAPRAVPIVEAMTLLVLADHYLRGRALTGGTAPGS